LIQMIFVGLCKAARGSGTCYRAALAVRLCNSINKIALIFSKSFTPGIAGNPFEFCETGGVLLYQVQRTAGPAFEPEFADANFQGGRQCFVQLA
jgi:hypothetical protein